MHTYEITIGIFGDRLTYLDVEHHQVRANTFAGAAEEAAAIKFNSKGRFDDRPRKREIIRIQRIA